MTIATTDHITNNTIVNPISSLRTRSTKRTAARRGCVRRTAAIHSSGVMALSAHSEPHGPCRDHHQR
jgi:hypothetical protein